MSCRKVICISGFVEACGARGVCKTMNVHFSSKTSEWATPQLVYDALHAEFVFTLDAAATTANAKCAHFYTRFDDGLSKDWIGERVFCNPPYGREIGRWVKKCAEGRAFVAVALLPARTDTQWFHNYILGTAQIRFLKGRLKFGNCKNSAPFPSMVCVWRANA
ncbi:MAG: DNA N-6-adenine-methyltransferase [Nitrosopumilaceae archaeon]